MKKNFVVLCLLAIALWTPGIVLAEVLTHAGAQVEITVPDKWKPPGNANKTRAGTSRNCRSISPTFNHSVPWFGTMGRRWSCCI